MQGVVGKLARCAAYKLLNVSYPAALQPAAMRLKTQACWACDGLPAVLAPRSRMDRKWSLASGGIRSMSSAPQPPDSAEAGIMQVIPEHDFDPEVLRALGIDHVDPKRIAEVLKSEDLSLEELKMLVDNGFHLPPPPPGNLNFTNQQQAEKARNATEWSMDLVHQINPKRRFFPGQTYSPEELSPNFKVDYSKIREEQRKLGCPLGGKKGPKLDYTNVGLLSRFVTEGGQIMPRRKTFICSKKQRELKQMVKRARTMNLMPYKSKLPQFQKPENFLLD